MNSIDYWDLRSKTWRETVIFPLVPSNFEYINLYPYLIDCKKILVLGNTPALQQFKDREITVVDFSQGMIDSCKTSNINYVMGNWLDLPFKNDTFDAIIGDGCLTLLEYPNEYQRLFKNVYQCLKPGGKFIMRVFTSLQTNVVNEGMQKFETAMSHVDENYCIDMNSLCDTYPEYALHKVVYSFPPLTKILEDMDAYFDIEDVLLSKFYPSIVMKK